MKTFKQFLAEDTLHDLSLQMAIRKELGVDQEVAQAVLARLRGEDISDEMDVEVSNELSYRFDDRLEKENVPHEKMDATAVRWMKQLLMNEYELKLNESEDKSTLLSSIIASLLKKGEKVRCFAEPWHPDPKARTANIFDIVSSENNRITFRISPSVTSWFDLGDTDEENSKMYFKQEKGIWTLREKKTKPFMV